MKKKNGPWVIKSSEQKYKNPWLEVVEDQVVRPDGKDGIYGTVKIKPGISVLPIDDKENVYLVKEFKYPLGTKSIETVGAGIDDGENPLQAAMRELKEELGIEAEEWIDLGMVHPVTSFIDSPSHLYLARKVRFTGRGLDGAESIRKFKVSLLKAVQMVMDNFITEQKSCCLILKAEKWLKEFAANGENH